MTHAIRMLIAIVLATGNAAAADKPNFSGEWKMNAAKSTFGALPPPDSITRKVTHAEPSLTIVEEQSSAMGEQKTSREYTTDGKETTFQVQGADVKGTATWEGEALVVVSLVEVAGLRFSDRMTMSADGKELTSAVHISSPQGEVDVTIVFDRHSPDHD